MIVRHKFDKDGFPFTEVLDYDKDGQPMASRFVDHYTEDGVKDKLLFNRQMDRNRKPQTPLDERTE
jgi:hypothetical protein